MARNLFTLLLAAAPAVLAHMELVYPPPFNSSNNPHTTGPSDPDLTYPYNCCGRKETRLCKGYLDLLGTPEGASVATWKAGSTQKWTIAGSGNHYGGSCQVGFSVDKGKTFTVATSYEGNCPHRNAGDGPDGQDFDFTVPADMPAGDVVFAWTWINREQEFNMNCAAVTIESGDGSITGGSASSKAGGSASSNVGASQPTAAPMSIPAAASTASAAKTRTRQNGSSPASSPTAVSAASTAQTSSSASSGTAFTMDGCTCTCASAPTKNQEGTYDLPSCSCTCDDKPEQAEAEQEPESKYRPKRARQGNNIPSTFRGRVSRRTPSDFAAWGASHPAKRDAEVKRAVAYSARPGMLFADMANGCTTPKTTVELKYPNPGPDVVSGDGEYPLQLPSGTCA